MVEQSRDTMELKICIQNAVVAAFTLSRVIQYCENVSGDVARFGSNDDGTTVTVT